MISFITPSLLQEEYNYGWIDNEGLRPYIGLGYINENQFNEIVNHQSVSD